MAASMRVGMLRSLRFTGSVAKPVKCSCGHARLFTSTVSATENYSSSTKPDVVVSKSGNVIICYHPTEEFPYEHSRPISRPDPTKPEQTHEDVLRHSYVKDLQKDRQGPDEIELAEMFHTTKHRWYPKNQKVKWQKKNPPRDREGC